MLQVLEKASSERAAIDRLLADQSAVIRNAFNQFLSGIRSRSTLSRIASAIRKGDINEALDIVNGYVEKFANVLPHVFVAAATEEIAQLRRRPLPVGGIKFAFDAGNPDAAKAIANSKLRFIRDFGTTQRNVTRKVLSEGLKAGDNPLTTARKFRDVIGLTENQAKAVANYQSMLERGSSEAFTRTLRDQRFDRTLASVIENDDVLEADQIERMVGRYTERMLAYRADTIARTETLRVVHEAKQTSWWQLLDSFGFDPDRVQRKWIATMDDATRDTHWAMHGQIVDGMDEPFLSPSGEELLYPGDEDADPSEVVNCRCSITYLLRSTPAKGE